MEHNAEGQRRAAENQALFRRVNERVEELNEAFEAFGPYGSWTCECADLACIDTVEMTLGEYEGVRAHASRFLVAPADKHVEPDADEVVERTDRYWLIEKLGAAGERAVELHSRR